MSGVNVSVSPTVSGCVINIVNSLSNSLCGCQVVETCRVSHIIYQQCPSISQLL